jgi:flagellar basal body-associated protein FliL
MQKQKLLIITTLIAFVISATGISSVYAVQYQSESNPSSSSNTPSSTSSPESSNMTMMDGNMTGGANMTGAGNISNVTQ